MRITFIVSIVATIGYALRLENFSMENGINPQHESSPEELAQAQSITYSALLSTADSLSRGAKQLLTSEVIDAPKTKVQPVQDPEEQTPQGAGAYSDNEFRQITGNPKKGSENAEVKKVGKDSAVK